MRETTTTTTNERAKEESIYVFMGFPLPLVYLSSNVCLKGMEWNWCEKEIWLQVATYRWLFIIEWFNNLFFLLFFFLQLLPVDLISDCKPHFASYLQEVVNGPVISFKIYIHNSLASHCQCAPLFEWNALLNYKIYLIAIYYCAEKKREREILDSSCPRKW